MKKLNFNTDDRSLKQYKNIFQSFFFKGISIASSFAIFPISLAYLSQTNYGIWLTIYSIVGWATFFDFGLGNGIKNKLIEALTLNDLNKARKIISTGYVLLFLIVIGLILIFSLLKIFVNWDKILNIKENGLTINTLIYICFVLFAVRLFFDLINQILIAHQRVSYTNFIGSVTNVLVLIAVYIVAKFNLIDFYNRLFVVGLIVSFIPVLVLLFYSAILFSTTYKHLSPSIGFFDKQYVNDVLSKGAQFFVIQIAALIIFTTDNLVIARLFSPSEVTVYNISYKLFSIFTIGWGIVLAPYWAAFSEAYLLSDFLWIKKTINNLLKWWLVMQLIIVVLLFFVNYIYIMWIGDNVKIPFSLSLFMALYIGLSTYCNIFAYLLNGLGKINLQLYTSIVAAIINIPLAIIFAKNLKFELSGIILATSVSLLIGAIFLTIQYKKLVSNKASGIWNK